MQVDLHGKTAVITGAGGAIGRAIALAFARNGCQVAVCDINQTAGQETVALLQAEGGRGAYFDCDVSNKEAVAACASAIVGAFGDVHILVNNAGVNVPADKRAHIQHFEDELWDWIVGVDLDSIYHCSKAFLPHVIQSRGNIVNISSIVGLVPLRNQCAFAAAKAGVINLSKAMALELGDEGVRVNVIAPGSIAMQGTAQLIYGDAGRTGEMLSQVPLGRAGTPEEIAAAALFLASDDASYVTGAVLTVDGGWTCGYARKF